MFLVRLNILYNSILPKCEKITTHLSLYSLPNLFSYFTRPKRERTESSAYTVCGIMKILIFIMIILYVDAKPLYYEIRVLSLCNRIMLAQPGGRKC